MFNIIGTTCIDVYILKHMHEYAKDYTLPYLLVWAPRRSLNFQSFKCGPHSGAALNRGRRSLKNILFVNYNKNFDPNPTAASTTA